MAARPVSGILKEEKRQTKFLRQSLRQRVHVFKLTDTKYFHGECSVCQGSFRLGDMVVSVEPWASGDRKTYYHSSWFQKRGA